MLEKDALEEVKKLTPDEIERLKDLANRAQTICDDFDEIDDDQLTVGQCNSLDDAQYAILSIPQLLAEVELLRSIVEDVSAIVGHPDAPYHPDLLEILNRKASGGSNA